MVLVDESHATGFTGPTGRGTHEKFGVMNRIDLVTTTLGKALGGGLGGATCGPRELIDWLRQKSRPYLFSNSLPPVVCGASLEVLRICKEDPEPLRRLDESQKRVRRELMALGFDIGHGDHPIIPVHFRRFDDDAPLAVAMSRDLLDEGIYCIGFSFPVVPKGQARIRLQISAAHREEHLDRLVAAFAKVGKKHGAI
jgi:glycine C-acetyltransferase